MYGLLGFLIIFLFTDGGFSQPIGNTYVAGTTWYDLQHNGSCGRMIALDEQGNAHMVWMNSLTNDTRHVFYNLWVAETQTFEYEWGEQMDTGSRAGYITLTVTPQGCPISVYHALNTGDPNPHATTTLCVPNSYVIPYYYERNFAVPIIWPHIASDVQGKFHVISLESALDTPLRIFYSRGIPEFDADGVPIGIQWHDYNNSGFMPIDTIYSSFGHDVTCSRNSERLVLGWSHCRDDLQNAPSQYDNDIMVQASEDGGLNWQPRRNITNFMGQDTFRSYNDLSLLFDQSDHIHAAFTTLGFYESRDSITVTASMIWHWNENTEQFSLIANGWVRSRALGAGLRNVQRPSLAVDESNGYLYCAYMRYDTSTFTQDLPQGYASADVWISVSTNNGSSWSEGTNVTRTTPSGHPVPQGESLHEREPTLAETVMNGMLHLTYVLDHDAGSTPQNEGVATLNEFIYQRIPVDSIPTTPLLPNYPLHWDSTGFLGVSEHHYPNIAKSFQLYPAYPNPFNSSTKISFDLPNTSKIELKVFDLLGREVETLKSGLIQSGHHEIIWNAEKFSSGIYFVNLKTGNLSKTQKVFYLR